ncbi:MAG: hypothetical protein WCL44_08705 [bacterium]
MRDQVMPMLRQRRVLCRQHRPSAKPAPIKPLSTFIPALFLILAATGCITTTPLVIRPDWLRAPKSDDGVYLYRDAQSDGFSTPEAARTAALQNAVAGIERDILGSVTGLRTSATRGIVPFTDVVPLIGCTYEEKTAAGYRAWIRVSFPQSLRDRLLGQLRDGVRLNDLWKQASQMRTSGQYAQALRLVEQAVESFGNPLLTDFSLPEAQIRIKELGRLRHGEVLNGIWNRARDLSDRHQFDDARALLGQAIADYGEPLGAKFTVVEAQDQIVALTRREQAEKLDGLWAETLKLEQQGAYQAATVKLRNLLEQYQPGLSVSFDSPTAKLKMAELYVEQKHFLEARRWYEDVAKNTQGSPAETAQTRLNSLPPPPRMWPLADRWGRPEKVAIVCAIRDDKGARLYGELALVLANDLREARMKSVDVGQTAQASSLFDTFSTQELSSMTQSAASGGASLLLSVLVDIDPKRRGKTEDLFGVQTLVPDTVVRFSITQNGSPVYIKQFKETAGKQSATHLAERVATILIGKYLVPSCPAVGEK